MEYGGADRGKAFLMKAVATTLSVLQLSELTVRKSLICYVLLLDGSHLSLVARILESSVSANAMGNNWEKGKKF